MATYCAPLVLRSNYSLLCGTTPIEDVVHEAKERGYSAVALTDINNLYGAIPFYKRARELGVKPIIGCDLRHDGSGAVLLAKNLSGYSNICRIITRRHLDPDFSLSETLARFQDGLHILTEDTRLAAKLASRVDKNYLWLMLARPGRRVSHQRDLLRQSETLGLRVVATLDMYFLDPEEYALHRVLTAIRQNSVVSRLDPSDLADPHSFLLSSREFQRLFSDYPEGLRNNAGIAEDCNLDIPMGRPIFPTFPLPEECTAPGFLEKLCVEGLRRRYPSVPQQAVERLRHELRIIEKLGFTGYFIFVWDILSHAREKGIPTVGRGSGASSIVSYLLGVTNVDPLTYNIPFERFLHLKRADCPDLDIDLCWIKRDDVIEGIYKKYGASHVAMVSTHSTFRLRGAIRETAKAFGVSNSIVSRLSKRLPYDSRRDVRSVLGRLPGNLRECVDGRVLQDVVRFAEGIRGFPRHLGIHCGGLVIGDRPLDTYVPLERATKGIVITQYEKDAIEEIGLVKMDFLGNHGLTIRDETIRLLREARKQDVRVEEIPDADPPTLKLLRTGSTIGCCQLESPAMRNLLQMLQVSSIKDIMQALALIRPGPASLGMKEKFVRRARGLEPTTFPHPSLVEVLGDSCGIMLYEDDAMLVACALAGVSPEEGDLLRKAISKRNSKEKLMDVSREFIQKALTNGVPLKVAEEMWTQMAKFTSYSFCKAHAASYAILAYQIAFLKAHYPLEFMTAALNHQWGMYPKRVHLGEAKRLGLKILLPCVNRSRREFAMENGKIRIGLEQVKGLSSATIDAILAERGKRPFDSLADFIARVRIGRTELEKLILCGAFDFFGRTRPELIWEAKSTFPSAKRRGSRTALLCPLPRSLRAPNFEDYPPAKRLQYELETLELSVTHHPLEFIRPRLNQCGFTESRSLQAMIGKPVRVAGILAAVRETDTQRNGAMQFFTLEDETGIFEVTLFPRTHRKYRNVIEDAGPYLVFGTVEEQYGAVTVNARKVSRLGGQGRLSSARWTATEDNAGAAARER